MLIYDFADNKKLAIINIEINNIQSFYEIGLKVLLKTIGGVFFIFAAAGLLCIPFILINGWLKKINQMNSDFDNLSDAFYILLFQMLFCQSFFYFL